MADCIFCKIAAGEIPANIAYQDDQCLFFHDLEPQAPVHLLAIPKVHIDGADTLTPQSAQVVAHIFSVIPKVASEQHLLRGFRVVTNVGEEGGQSVRHLHFHILAGRPLGWPPG